MATAVALLLSSASAQTPADVAVPIRVRNDADTARCELVPVSLPLPPGALAPLAPGAVVPVAVTPSASAAVSAPALPLLRWPDGTIALLQAHVRVALPPRAEVRAVVAIAADAAARAGAPAPHRPLLPDPLPLWTELVDPWGRVFRADLVPDPLAGPDGVLSDSGAIRVRRFRAAHRGVDGDACGRPLLDLRAYLTTFDGERRGELVLVLDDTAPEAPLGPVRFQGFRLCTGDAQLRFLPAFAAENLLPPPQLRADRGRDQWLLAPGRAHYLGDGTAKAFRVFLFADGADVAAEQRAAAAWAPVRAAAFADLGAVRRSGAFAGFGGPAPVLPADAGDEAAQLRLWRDGARFGPWGDFGDPADPTGGDAVRHGDSLLHNVLRWHSAQLLLAAEGMVLQHALRPVSGRAVRLPSDVAAWRQGLPDRAVTHPHGFAPIDYEHCSVHLLYDFWWLTGDAFARDELRRVGASIPAMLAAVPFRTARGEGRCLEAAALCARATGDAELGRRLQQHVVDRVLPALQPAASGTALLQPPHPLVLGGDAAFDAPAQMAALVRGLAAVHRLGSDERVRRAALAVADAMAGPAWLDGVGPKTFVGGDSPGRYTMAALPEDRFGRDRTTIGAFVLAERLSDDPAAAARYRARAEFLLRRDLAPDTELAARLRAHANPWLQLLLDRRTSP